MSDKSMSQLFMENTNIWFKGTKKELKKNTNKMNDHPVRYEQKSSIRGSGNLRVPRGGARDAAIALPRLLPLFVEANPDFPRTGCQYSYKLLPVTQ